MTEHLSVDQSVSLGGAAVIIILPSPDQTQPATEDRGLEKFIVQAATGSFFLEICHRFTKQRLSISLSYFHIIILLSSIFIFEIQTELFIF